MQHYEEVLEWMYGRLPYYQRQGKKAVKKDLRNINLFLEHLGHPERQFPAVHVAGTNGKGSVSSMLASVLMEAGYRTGLYTSPHLTDFRERILVNGKKISRKIIMGFIRKHKDFIEANGMSFFEVTVAMAFYYFARMKVDVAVVETGLGGRLDSTNTVHPEVSVITTVDYDHTDFLGDTLEKIAREKAGIIKPGIPVVIGKMPAEAEAEIRRTAAENASELTEASYVHPGYTVDLEGPYQHENIPVVYAVVHKLRNRGWQIPDEAVRKGLERVRQNTGLRGRWDIISTHPAIILDVGHNPGAFRHLIPALRKKMAEKKYLLLSFVEGKDVEGMARMLPRDWHYLLTQAQIPRAMPAERVAEIFRRAGHEHIEVFPSVAGALSRIYPALNKGDLLFIGGSTFTVAEALPLFRFRRGKVTGIYVTQGA
ncbi:MAG: bifunctional folylpolyglutamate synthase/dihydrofolate synthase [Chlorobi bacterium]|nr:bifunctional folylpolyglutamate synthase/dihydrofolate synthase [Chlorobiota bacterium]